MDNTIMIIIIIDDYLFQLDSIPITPINLQLFVRIHLWNHLSLGNSLQIICECSALIR